MENKEKSLRDRTIGKSVTNAKKKEIAEKSEEWNKKYSKRSTSDGYMPKTTLVSKTPLKSLSKERKYNVESYNKPQVKSKQRNAQ